MNYSEQLTAGRDAAFARTEQAIVNSEALGASVDAALARCERKVALAQIILDNLNDSVAYNPEQLEFETRIRGRCPCADCALWRKSITAH
jgi:hypothetical protein